MIKVLMFFYVLFFFACTHLVNPKEGLKRVALVIGNQRYLNNELRNPINDARAIQKTLEGMGFEVVSVFDSTLYQLNQALNVLKTKIEPHNTIVFIYFAGHGNTLSKNGSEEYLMMTDSDKKVLVSIYKFYDFLEKVKSKHNIIAIDACRDYQPPYNVITHQKNIQILQNFRGNFRRLHVRYDDGMIEDQEIVLDNNYSYYLPASTIISYATMHHQKAKDWSVYDKGHSPYSYALIHYLDDEEIPIEEVFRRVRVSLLNETNRTQSNLEELNLEKNIWLVPKQANVAVAPAF